MALGVRGSNPIWVGVDLQGNLFDDNFYMYVLENTIPYVPASVYHYADLTSPWTNPIQYLGNGTLPVDIYWDPSKLYRLEFRQNNGLQAPSQNDPLIYEVNNYSPGGSGSGPIDTVAFASVNQITNPQFALTAFSSPFSLNSVNNPPAIPVGGGWFLELTGTGSAILEQIPLNSGTPTPTNAPYMLRLQLNGWDEGGVYLRQRFNGNGVLWANKYISASITARIATAPQPLSSYLIDSNDVVMGTVLNIPVVNASFTQFTDSIQLGDSTNPELPPAAYIEYRINIPANVDIYLSSVQLLAQDTAAQPPFIQDTVDRQIDYTFHQSKPQLEFKPIKSYLTAWDFPLNPAQFTGPSVPSHASGAHSAYYVWDQTIIFQTLTSAVAISRETNGALTLTCASTGAQLGLIQYLSGAQAKDILLQAAMGGLSVNIRGSAAQAHTLNVSLWYTNNATLPTLPASFVGGLTGTGKPSGILSGWTEITRNTPQEAIASLGTTYQDHGFSGWEVAGQNVANSANFVAIFIGTDVMTSGNAIHIESISLVPGEVPTVPAPQTPSQVLEECQYYWEKTYSPLTYAGASSAYESCVTFSSSSLSVPGSNSAFSYPSPIGFNYQSKRTRPNITFYSPENGAANSINAILYYENTGLNLFAHSLNAVVATYWNVDQSVKGVFLTPKIVTPLVAVADASGSALYSSSACFFHAIMDARLGAVA